MKAFDEIDCAFPETLEEALQLQANEATRGVPLGGCSDLMVQWESGALPVPTRAIHVKDLPELTAIDETANAVRIGGGATHMALRRSELVQQFVPSLSAAAATVGGFQMQSQGTLAGSIANASPAGDLAPSLLACDSLVVVASVRGERELPLRDFMLGYRKIDLQPDELIVRFVVPKRPEGSREGFRKLGPRAAQAISKVMGAYRGVAEGGIVKSFNVALGSVAPTAVRLPRLEDWVRGRHIDTATKEEAAKRASEEVQPIADIRSTAEYRKWVSGQLVRFFLEELGA